LLGQLARYMDDNMCRYSFYTTYQHNWFIRRKDDFHFYFSPIITHDAVASSSQLSLRECFLFLGLEVAKDYKYEIRIGRSLVCFIFHFFWAYTCDWLC
jgi:hypothetical protein